MLLYGSNESFNWTKTTSKYNSYDGTRMGKYIFLFHNNINSFKLISYIEKIENIDLLYNIFVTEPCSI